MGSVQGLKVLVTAGCQGIGLAISEALIRSGADVAATYLSSRDGAERLSALAGEHGTVFASRQADLRTRDACREVVGFAVEELGGLQAVVNNAGSLVERRAIEELDPEFLDELMHLNLSSTVWTTQAAIEHLAGNESGASIVNLASLAGRKGGHTGSIAYSTSKGAVITWTRHAATELGPRGIRVYCVAPGLILGTAFHRTHTTEDSARQTITQIPLGRAGNPDDVARVVAYLVSEYDGFITGTTIDINGGMYVA